MPAKSTNPETSCHALLETGRHLFQPPMYCEEDGHWSSNFQDVAARCPKLSWDPAAILSYLTYGYVSGDRTLFQQIKRQPWVSTLDPEGNVQLERPPEHDFFRLTPTQIGARLLELLESEAESVCTGRSDVYVLTSGGLDSRIVAGVMRRLLDQGRLKANVHAVTWGRDGSRDVEIGKLVANELDFPWTHLELGSEHLVENIDHAAFELGAMISPIHLHRMMWFRDLPPHSLVLGGSYGDSVGRAEFSGRNVLELLPYQANNLFGLLTPQALAVGQQLLNQDWEAFRNRLTGRPGFGVRECEFQAHYMRGLIAQTMSVINGTAHLYQMFTAPEVYGFMWSVHPSFRDDRPYAALLEQLGCKLDRLPWARTNRALGTRNSIQVQARHKQYHDYVGWIRTDILPNLDQAKIVDWLAETALFDRPAICKTFDMARQSQVPLEIRQSTNLVLWMLTLKKLSDSLATHPSLELNNSPEGVSLAPTSQPTTPKPSISRLRRSLREIPFALSTVRRVRKWFRRRQALKQYPPKHGSP